MSCRIRVMAGDTQPSVVAAINDEKTGPVNLSDPAVLPYMKFRQVGTIDTLQTILGVKLPGVPTCSGEIDPGEGLPGEGGLVRFDWPTGALDVKPGNYEGEVSIHEDNFILTVQDRIQFVVRETFA